MAPPPHDKGPQDRERPRSQPNTGDIAQAIRELGVVTREAASSFTYAVHDVGAELSETVRATGTAILAAFTEQHTPRDNGFKSEANAQHARKNGGRVLRPLSEKTDSEKAMLQRIRARTRKDGEL